MIEKIPSEYQLCNIISLVFNNVPSAEDEAANLSSSFSWNTGQAAAYLGIAPKTLRNRRVIGGQDAIPYLKIGSRVRYRPRDVIEYADSGVRRSSSDEGAQP